MGLTLQSQLRRILIPQPDDGDHGDDDDDDDGDDHGDDDDMDKKKVIVMTLEPSRRPSPWLGS